jgi:hypothetical protein
MHRKLVQPWLRRWTAGWVPADGWEYKVVQMVAQTPADPTDASKRLGGALSPESLRNQFPEHYGGINGRQQISDFLNRLGDDNWELVQVQQIAELPLMIFKRPKQLANPSAGAKPGEMAPQPHAEETKG